MLLFPEKSQPVNKKIHADFLRGLVTAPDYEKMPALLLLRQGLLVLGSDQPFQVPAWPSSLQDQGLARELKGPGSCVNPLNPPFQSASPATSV